MVINTLRNTQITFRKKNKDVKDIEKNAHDKKMLNYIYKKKDGSFLLPRKLPSFFVLFNCEFYFSEEESVSLALRFSLINNASIKPITINTVVKINAASTP